MTPLAELRDKVTQEVIDVLVLTDVLRRYRKPADRTARMVNDGDIVRVRKGLYVFGPPFRRQVIVREQLANLIYGPSYVSLDSALSFHGLIPERVDTVTSVTTGRFREFESPFGSFSCHSFTRNRYSTGVTLVTSGIVSFLIATPEKALADKVWTDKRFSGCMSDFEDYLREDFRLDLSALSERDLARLRDIERSYNPRKVSNLVQ
ncbi:MAG TPA: hypothetical protein VGK19_24815 [Capsulimonadaceae bacterium]|jgi:predicted transcriptional regulator of viral defense system